MIESILYKTAIYCRLSLDDGSLGESGSIQTQKMMLEKYCRDNNFTIKEVYIDDGYSGLNFDRPAFKRLIADIESGKINLVINLFAVWIATSLWHGFHVHYIIWGMMIFAFIILEKFFLKKFL